MSIVQAKKIFDNSEFVGQCAVFSSINCERIIGSPKVGWLIRKDPGNLEYSIVTQDPKDPYAIKGVFINLDGVGILVDGTLADFTEQCRECCGQDTTVTPIYNGVYPDNQGPVAKTFTVVRIDDGSLKAQEDLLYDYLGYIIPKTMGRTNRNNGTNESTYVFQSYANNLPPMKADVVTETPLVFDSNAPGAFTGSNDTYRLTVTVDGVPLSPTNVTAATIANLAAAATTAWGTTYGTFSSALSNTIVRLTTTKADRATLVATQFDAP